MRFHGPYAVLAAQKTGVCVDLHELAPLCQSGGLDIARMQNTRVVDEHIQWSKLLCHKGHGFRPSGLAGDLVFDKCCILAVARCQGGTRIHVDIADHHARALLNAQRHGGTAKTTGATGNQNRFVYKALHLTFL